MVSRYLAEMEQWVGVRLLHRTTRRLSLTPAGAETLPRCRQMLDMVGDLRSAVSTPEDTPRGLLRMTTSMSFGSRHLARVITDYVKLHPGTSVDLMLVDRTVNLVEERVDLAVRITNDLDPNLIARKLAVCRSIVCASPDYLQREGEPARVEDLSLRNCLTHSYFGKSLWRFEREGVPVDVPVSGNISANEVSVLLQAALEGAGVAMLPTYYAAEYVAQGRLKVILPQAKPQELGIYGVYASRRQMPLILRSMLDFLVERLGPAPWDQS
ncbi:LysR family regulatory helix-turn-helix protein 51 [Achromobacter insuavis AXX-A]|nr:LysR family regulatory helix-turn-helix protein 51 [Achromobacter insuavis AXX-A]